jgi:ankyrin repeat protein
MVKKLLSNGANVDCGDRGDGTALHLASLHQFYDVAEELIRNGANVNKRDIAEQTALHLACKNGDRDMVLLLLRNGAEADLMALTGDTPLRIAYNNNFSHIIECLIHKVRNVPQYIIDWIIDKQEFGMMDTLIREKGKTDALIKKLVILNKKQALDKVAGILKSEHINICSIQEVTYDKNVEAATLLSVAILNNSLDVADILMRNNSVKTTATIKKLSELVDDEMADNFLEDIKNSTVRKIKIRKREIENMLICKLLLDGKKQRKRMLVEKVEERTIKRSRVLE